MAKQTIYTVGGTVQAGGGIYIKRKADDELLELCRQGEFAFILSSRQVGKSSLMVRTAQQLEKENIRSVTIDLSAIGVKVTQDEWYLGILNEIATTLNLETDIFGWWKQYAQLGPAQRLTNFFRDVLLKEVKEQIVLFFDEIDSTLSIPYSDDFYVALRAVYNARSINPDFKRLSFVLVGVAAPSDLISDNKRTPFNIGHRVEVNDFTLAEALPLANGLGEQAVQALTWVFQYTGGHPYLTQRICAHLATSKEALDESAVANAVERLFTGEQGKQDNNLQFVRDMLSKRSPDVSRVLLIYRDIRSGKKVIDDERSITKAHLKLSGLVRSEKGILRVRNEIYNTVFNLQWVQENIPKNWQKVALISLSAALGILILGTLAIFINDYFVGSRIDKRFRSFISAGSPEQRLSDLAEIYRQSGILSNRDSEFTASQLFYGLSSAEDQLALFRVYGLHEKPVLQTDLIVVINHLYITVANVDPEENNTELLQAMYAALDGISSNQAATDIQAEIAAWLDGRKKFADGNYEAALSSYNDAIFLNSGNPATLYERAKVYIALKKYTDALNDLESTIKAAKQLAPEMPATPMPTVSSLPASETPNISNGETIGPTLLAQTSVTTQITEMATDAIPTSGEPTLSLTLTPTTLPIYTPNVRKYESNFTTLIEVVNAVKVLIEQTAQLQIMMQSNGNNSYTNLQDVGLVSTISPIPSDASLGDSTMTSSPETAYDFAAVVCSGTWFSGAGQLPCPGVDGDEKGFVLSVANPILESGETDTRPGLLTFPQSSENGYIQGFYPPFKVQDGDRFRSIISCEGGAVNCYVAFRLDYQIGSDPIRTFWGPFLERQDGQLYAADVDLSALAGNDVKFILVVFSAGDTTDDRAQWIAPHIYRVTALESTANSISTPTLPAGSTRASSIGDMTLVYIPAGQFTMGLSNDQVETLRSLCNGIIGCEELLLNSHNYNVALSDFWISQTEISNGSYALCVSSRGCTEPQSRNDETAYINSNYYALPDFSNYPVVWVSWTQAREYCNWAGGDLPTSAQWEYAARGNDGRLFPWGNTFPDAEHANVNHLDGQAPLQPVDAFKDYPSPFGLLNTAGNVWEWMLDWYDPNFYDSKTTLIDPIVDSDKNNISGSPAKVVRGSSAWHLSALASVAVQDWEYPDNPNFGIGFRCALPAE